MLRRLQWLDEGFALRLRPAGVLLAVAYAFAVPLARALSEDQWALSAGLRVAALLLFPYRYWPYLFVGEWAAMFGRDWSSVDTRGLAWVLVPMVNMPLVAWIIYSHRRYRAAGGYGWFLSVAALAAVAVTLLNIGVDTFLRAPIDFSRSIPWVRALRWALGDYLGILLLGLLALLWQQRADLGFSRRLGWDAGLALAVMGLLAVAVLGAQDADLIDRNGLRLLMLLPAVALTCLHGWRGAAIGVVAVNLAIYLSMDRAMLQNAHDMEAFMVQQAFALIATTLLGAGATISYYYQQYARHRSHEQQLADLAKASVLAGEAKRRQHAQRVHALSAALERPDEELLAWLQARGYSGLSQDLQASSAAQARQVREQLSLLYPADIERAGLYVALASGAIAGVWEQSDRLAHPELRGDPGGLSHTLQHVAYDCITDAVDLLLEQEPGTLQVRSRCGQFGAVQGILIQVGVLDPQRRLGADTVARARGLLAGRALAYGGSLRCRRNTISLLLSEPVQVGSTGTAYSSSSTCNIKPLPST